MENMMKNDNSNLHNTKQRSSKRPRKPKTIAMPIILYDYWIYHLFGDQFKIVSALCKNKDEGLNINYFVDLFLKGPREIEKIINPLVKSGLVSFENNQISLTERFFIGGSI